MLFGGRIYPEQPAIKYSSEIPSYYYLLNFNDVFSSYITLFALMVVNNWMEIVGMYAIVLNTNQVRWFFLTFYYFSVMIGINIIIGFAIDMYVAIAEMDKRKAKSMQELYELAKLKDKVNDSKKDSPKELKDNKSDKDN